MSSAHAARAEFPSALRSHHAVPVERQPDVRPMAASDCARPDTTRLAFLTALPLDRIPREPGTAVFIGTDGQIDANGFLRVLASSKRLPARVLFVTTHVEPVPTVADAKRVDLVALSDGILRVALHHGFDDEPDIPRFLGGIEGFELDTAATRYYVADDRPPHRWIRGMPAWRRWIFAMLSSACVSAAEHFRLPADRTTRMPAGERIPRHSTVHGAVLRAMSRGR
jgi:K+ transporter